jgi:beta-galactosidase
MNISFSMRKRTSLITGFLFFVILNANTQTIRTILNYNRDWRFCLGDVPGGEASVFDDTRWEPIGLPHSFSIPYFLSSDFYVGYGWYRKHFNVPPDYQGKRLFIEFEGAFQDAEIFVNGQKAGQHQGGYTGFSIDVTDKAIPGDNVIAVRLNNLWNPRLAPRAGEHVFSGGIYRDVHLVVTDPVHVAWCGTFITTPEVSAKHAMVNIKTEVKNDDNKARIVKLKTELFDPDGKLVASLSSTKTIAAGITEVFDQTSSPVNSPKLWHPDHPFLYLAVSCLMGKCPKIGTRLALVSDPFPGLRIRVFL